MFRYHALAGVSVVAIQVALSASSDVAQAQSGEQGVLPPITVTAPQAPARRAVRKPANQAAVRRRTTPVAVPDRQRPVVVVETEGAGTNASLGTPPAVARFQLPQQSFSITDKQIDETINLKDPEDAVKYMPSLFVRKRNDGDNQAVLATRSWGLNSSARTLIYYDDLLISALIGNNNSGASPKWNLISPEAIARIDFLNGPFSAAYPGNSIGGVLLITSKMPDKPFAVAKETVSVMPWNQYGTKDTYVTSQTSAAAGNRKGPLSWLVTANYLDSYQQPLTYTTFGTVFGVGPANTTGTFRRSNRTGGIANVIGTGALAHSQQTSGNLRLAYDISPLVQATYSLGIWNNHQTSDPQTYLTSTATGQPTFGGQGAFASNKYTWDQTHMSNAVSLKSDTKGVFDFDLSASSYNYLQDIHAQSVHRRAVSDGRRLFAERQDHAQRRHELAERRRQGHLASVRRRWPAGDQLRRSRRPLPAGKSGLCLDSLVRDVIDRHRSALFGRDRRDAHRRLWVQDAWKIAPNLKLTLGGRLETWQALDGFNINSNRQPIPASRPRRYPIVPVPKNQPGLNSTNFSPKASLSYDPNKDWNITANFGEAYRYPTVTELYQNIVVGGVRPSPIRT